MLEILTFRKGVYQSYKKNINGGEETSLDLAQRKMTRNMLLAKRVGENMYQYGKLWFVVEDGTVIWLSNHCPKPNKWKKNVKKYMELNKLLGIYS